MKNLIPFNEGEIDRVPHVLLDGNQRSATTTWALAGHVRAGLTLSDREWSCHECGVIHDRDSNAAINFRMGFEVVPVLRPLLPHSDQLLPYLRRIDASRYYSNRGPLVLELEERLADYLGLREGRVVTAASGTSALVGAILAVAGRATPKRPLALLPAFTFVGTASAVEECGYRAYLADIDDKSWMLDPQRLVNFSELDKVGVVVPVAPFGRPVPQEPWLAFRRRTGIAVVIDGAASLDGLADAPEQFLGDIQVALSFHATKSFATGEGGGVVSTDRDLAKRVVQTLNFGFYGERNSRVSGTNGKMSEYHAAVGLAELDGWSAKRAALRAVADWYRWHLKQAGLLERFFASPNVSGCYALFHCVKEEVARVRESLQRHGVDFRLWYGSGLHHHAYFANLPHERLEVTDTIAPSLLGLPVAPDLTEAMITRVVAGLVAGVQGCD
jgi:dTDP-4-amino-4,6-dideoxygalactose transaminase